MSDAVNICPRFHVAVELVGGRWTGAIINRLLAGRARYNELRAAIPEISDRMLSERLRVLETEGVVTRTVVPESPVRVEYELTTKGRALEDAIEAIGKWATRWISEEDLARNTGSTTPEAPRRQSSPGRSTSAKRRPRASARKRPS
jgi:DNA-binding HxlR family transcriptional regulator